MSLKHKSIFLWNNYLRNHGFKPALEKVDFLREELVEALRLPSPEIRWSNLKTQVYADKSNHQSQSPRLKTFTCICQWK